ncbi:restriction endonuclease subunit S [Ligilactobacillus animalis]|uniref:restriction endonuclease subunit S n=1 Tax=Ligilactobacillus animalis TaxID=1605 RepID=UPI00384F25B0
MINISSWKKYRIEDLFDIRPTKHYNAKNALLFDELGTNPVVGNVAYNNGIGGYTDKPNTEKGNIITFSDTTNANTIFYRESDFVGYSHVQGMYPKFNRVTPNILMFILTIFYKTAINKGYDYDFKFTRNYAKNIEIPLPTTHQQEIDFDFMEEYIENIKQNVNYRIKLIKHIKDTPVRIDVNKWKKFHLYDDQLFEIDMGNKLDKIKMTDKNPTIDFVGRSHNNNGVTAKVDKIFGIQPYKPGYLTLALGGEYLGSCFVQQNNFYTSQNLVVLKPKTKMTMYQKQFIATMIFKEGRRKYKAFVDELNRHVKSDFSFYLPVINDTSNIDWEFMEQFMKKQAVKAEQNFNFFNTNS